MKAFCDFLSLICTGFFSFVIMVYGIKMTAGSFETRELTNTPMSVPLAWVQIWVPIAFGVMGLMAVLIIVDKIAFSKTDKRHEKIANVGTTD
jgi:TRAP-type C4-dicarboxylate transport system permease small subunit